MNNNILNNNILYRSLLYGIISVLTGYCYYKNSIDYSNECDIVTIILFCLFPAFVSLLGFYDIFNKM